MEARTNEALIEEMVRFDAGRPDLIQHFIKVFEFARVIAEAERLSPAERRILESAAILHDIGIFPAERKYGHCTGKMQEEIGPGYARELLENFGGFTPAEIDRICWLIAHHHTYENVTGADYRILLEADFLVNAFENGLKPDAVREGRERIFRTECGTRLLNTMFGL